MEQRHKTYGLAELCGRIADTLHREMHDAYWVRAEISSVSEKGGHGYFELVEKADFGGVFAAKIRAVCWSNVYGMLRAYFQSQTQTRLQSGMQVLVKVTVSMHAVYGLSLVIHDIDPAFTLGDIAQQRQQTIKRLQEEGVMHLNKLLSFPTLPQRIAVISSAEAAGYGDFRNQLQENSYGFPFQITLFSALMQGDRAAQSIIEALNRVHKQADDYQVVLILRGGGATTDLACFDDYELASHCAQFPLPIVAGIGHQRDVSVVDMVAHSSVKTPTAAAELLISKMVAAWERMETLRRRLEQVGEKRMLLLRHALERREIRLQHVLQRFLLQQRNKLLFYEKAVALHSPEKIYRMGYSLTRVNGQVVRDVASVQVGDRLETELAEGRICSQVVEIEI